MLLNALDDKVYAYDYQIVENNEIELKGQTFNEEQTRQELTSLAFINKLSDLSLNGISFEKIDILFKKFGKLGFAGEIDGKY